MIEFKNICLEYFFPLVLLFSYCILVCCQRLFVNVSLAQRIARAKEYYRMGFRALKLPRGRHGKVGKRNREKIQRTTRAMDRIKWGANREANYNYQSSVSPSWIMSCLSRMLGPNIIVTGARIAQIGRNQCPLLSITKTP